MKLNKKLLTAALAGALIVTAVPASTFAANSGNIDYSEFENLSKEEAAKVLADLATQIDTLSKKRKAIVAKEYKKGSDSLGLIEDLQRKEAAAKKAYEAAKAKYEAATKGLEAAKDAEEKARLAYQEAGDKAAGVKAEYDKLLKAAQDKHDAAYEEALRQYRTTTGKNLTRKAETIETKLDNAKIELNKVEKALEEAKAAKPANDGEIARLNKEVADKKGEVARLQNEYDAAVIEQNDVIAAAKETLRNARKQADSELKAEENKLNKKYILNDMYGDENVADATKAERAKRNAGRAYIAAKENTVAAQAEYDAAEEDYNKKAEAYAQANQKAYKITEELKNIEKQLKEIYVKINTVLKDQNKGINSLAGKIDKDMIKEIEDFSKLSSSEQYEKLAQLQKDLVKIKEEYNKVNDELKQVKALVTYKFNVVDTKNNAVEGLGLKLTNVDDTSKVYTAVSGKDGVILFKSMVQGKYTVEVTKVPTGYKVVQDGKTIDSVKALFRAESEVKAENNVEEENENKGTIVVPGHVTVGDVEDEKDNKDDEKVIDGGTIVVDKEKDNKDEKDNTKKPEDNKKPEKEEKENNKKPAKPDMPKKKLPKAGAAAEAATIAAAAMATMGGAYLSLKKRK